MTPRPNGVDCSSEHCELNEANVTPLSRPHQSGKPLILTQLPKNMGMTYRYTNFKSPLILHAQKKPSKGPEGQMKQIVHNTKQLDFVMGSSISNQKIVHQMGVKSTNRHDNNEGCTMSKVQPNVAVGTRQCNKFFIPLVIDEFRKPE